MEGPDGGPDGGPLGGTDGGPMVRTLWWTAWRA